MEARDILRIVLFFVIAIFALREVLLLKARKVTQLYSEVEKEDTASQQLHQKSQRIRNTIMNEQIEYENELSEKI
jgi:hypothetical protein